MMTPSIVGVPAVVLSMTALRRSPAAAIHAIAGVLSSEGVVPAVPPPCTGLRSWMVSDPLYTVALRLTSVERNSKIICAGHGRNSYCHPEMGLRPSWLAVSAVEKTNCGIFVLLVVTIAANRATQALTANFVNFLVAPRALHHFLRFLNPPKRAFFLGCTRWIVFMARRANPCARRSARLRARGLVTRMWRFFTHWPKCLLCFDLLMWWPLGHAAPAIISRSATAPPTAPTVAAPAPALRTRSFAIMAPPRRMIAPPRDTARSAIVALITLVAPPPLTPRPPTPPPPAMNPPATPPPFPLKEKKPGSPEE